MPWIPVYSSGSSQPKSPLIGTVVYYRPHPKCEGYIFTGVCLLTGGWGGVPHLHPIMLPLVPCPILGVGVPQAGQVPSWSRGFPGQVKMGYPHPSLGQGWGNSTCPQPGQGWDTLLPGQVRLRYSPPPPNPPTPTGQALDCYLRFSAGGLSCCYTVFHLQRVKRCRGNFS